MRQIKEKHYFLKVLPIVCILQALFSYQVCFQISATNTAHRFKDIRVTFFLKELCPDISSDFKNKLRT